MVDKIRCNWAKNSFEAYEKYHDEEWGVPVHNDQKHFEFLVLEGAQAGLSWATVLKKREGYRKAFAGFDYKKIAVFEEAKIEELVLDPSIIRNRLKIKSVISNAKCFIKVQEEFETFDKYIWGFVDDKPIINKWDDMSQVPASTKESDALSKDLKKRGFKFVGTTIMYAHMQACGLVNDHSVDCYRYKEVQV